MIFGEADFLPGLVVDKFSDVLVVQSLALGIDRLKDQIVELLKEVLAADGIKIRGVYERSDAKVRRQEGMELYKGFIGEAFDTNVEIEENGVRYMVDVKDGQKTGFFLDQKYNRKAIQHLCKDAKVLDCFTHTGSFALNAGYGGAKEVTGVDASELAVEQATLNSKLNGMEDRVKFICRDVFELLPELEEKGEKFDVVILDPPAVFPLTAPVLSQLLMLPDCILPATPPTLALSAAVTVMAFSQSDSALALYRPTIPPTLSRLFAAVRVPLVLHLVRLPDAVPAIPPIWPDAAV